LTESTPPSTPAGGTWPTLRRSTSLGINVPNSERNHFLGTPHYADILAMSQAAVGAGFEVLWFDDHFSFPSDEGLRGQWDVWTQMAAIAAQLPDVHIGPMVACTAYRNPGVIAKMSEMIADINGGRFILGLGAGWQKDEYDQFGIRFEPRVSQFEEALRIIHGLVRDGAVDYQGTYYQANDAQNLPRAENGPRMPILIGSTSDRMLGLLVRYADAWNTGWSGDTEALKARIAKLDAACEAAGRDPKTVVRTVGVELSVEGSPKSGAGQISGGFDEQLSRLREIEALGVDHILIRITPSTPQTIADLEGLVTAFYGEA
jgi:alkanesulfonate monooxygenase SsuD/methylene tetrahydromethanopterin reductase-like flavin-dependent oxidoreductase (luciferase family)